MLVCLSFASPAHAADWPSKPIRLIHGFTAGGNVDITARIVAQVLSEAYGQPVIVDGRPGAGGTLAAGHRRQVGAGRLYAFHDGFGTQHLAGPLSFTALRPGQRFHDGLAGVELFRS
jgi:tripartite-type tricarboxylate transporter receptor subunit TctC